MSSGSTSEDVARSSNHSTTSIKKVTVHDETFNALRQANMPGVSLFGRDNVVKNGSTYSASLIVVMLYTFLYVLSFVIVLPTSRAYVEILGGNSDLMGIVVGLTPIISGICQLPIMTLLKYVPIRKVLLYSCAWLCLMQILYALAGWINSLTVLMLSRALMGLGE